ncbi:hypothetical protein ANO14919_061100 [Xylariales sp. No.14919]|nr:hypothetical protein ANO14919_061100 [Xylariales sp. No.14919]
MCPSPPKRTSEGVVRPGSVVGLQVLTPKTETQQI